MQIREKAKVVKIILSVQLRPKDWQSYSGHLMWMDEDRFTASLAQERRRKRGRPRKRWLEDVEQAMAARGLGERETGRIESGGYWATGDMTT